MVNWKHELNITRPYMLLNANQITPTCAGKQVASIIRGKKWYKFYDFTRTIASRFSKTKTTDDFFILLEELYTWGDKQLSDEPLGQRLCHIITDKV